MQAGTILLGASLLAGLASFALNALPPRRVAWAPLAAHRAFVLSWSALAGALAAMVTAFLAGDLSVEYVWEHTRVDYPFFYKLAGLWGGQKGTALLWAFLLATCLLAETRRALGSLASPDFAVRASRGAPDAHRVALHRVVHALLLAVVLAFVAFLLADEAFRETPIGVLQSSTGAAGRGLQEVLITPLMVIHPPLQFVGYALCAVPAALALAALAARAPTRAWTTPALAWARVAWGVATLGLGLGGLWAYYVLSFGGYWAWDPVETANLLPWLALTAFLHAGKYADKFDEYRLAAPVFAFLAFWLTLFATFATRSGLWVSVHAFTDPTNRFDPDALARLVSIMESHLATRFFVSLLVASAAVAGALLVRRHALDLPRGASVARGYALFAAALAGFALAAPTTLLSLLFDAGRFVGFGRAAAGFGVLVALAVGGPAVWIYLEEPERARASRERRDWSRALMLAAVLLFGVALAVALLLDLQVVNTMDRGVFDARAPLIAAPLVSVLTAMMAHTVFGKRAAAALAAGALALGAIAAFVWRDWWAVALAIPVALGALVATIAKLAHVNRGATGAARAGGVMLLASALLAMIQWSNPPTRVAGFEIPWGLAFPGFALGALALLGAMCALRGARPGLARAGAVAGALAVGYGAGALLALAALALLARAEWREVPTLAPNLRQTGIYLVHVAVALAVLGYAVSTYGQSKDAWEGMPLGTSAPFADGTVAVGRAGGTAESLVVPITLASGGRTTTAEIAFAYKPPPLAHYAQDLRVERGLFRDVYAAGFGVTFGGDEVKTLEPTLARSPEDVTAVTFELTVLPLMTLVWAGLWIMVLGVSLVVAAAVVERRR